MGGAKRGSLTHPALAARVVYQARPLSQQIGHALSGPFALTRFLGHLEMPMMSLDATIKAQGERLFARMCQQPRGFFSKRGIYDRLMEWSMRDPAFKTQLFRFVDVLPSLNSGAEIVRHLREYLDAQARVLHPWLASGLRTASVAPALSAWLIKEQMGTMARRFVAGKDASDLLRRYRSNLRDGMTTTVDLLGEAVVSEAEAEAFLARNLEMLETLSKAFPEGSKPGDLNLSVKISALSPEIDPQDPERSLEALKIRLRPILRRAAASGAFINFDMESYRLKDLTLALFKSVLEEPEFRSGPAAGIALQAYLRDCEADLLDLIRWTREQERKIGVRLVKGAYWDYESITARQKHWPVPVWESKPESDACFEALSLLLLENIDTVEPAFASHNVRSVAHAIAQAERLGIAPGAYEFQALYGMADDLKRALIEEGFRVREYCPVGELLPGMAYLVRRLLENTSNEGFLRAWDRGEAEIDELLRDPRDRLVQPPPRPTSSPSARDRFINAPNTDFTRPEARMRFRKALAAIDSGRGKHHPLVIGGQRRPGSGAVPSANPARPKEILGTWSRATPADAEAAVKAARLAQPTWEATPQEDRSAILERAASLMEEKRFELAALEVREAGKPWGEADADVSEAIDFCRFYATQMRRRVPALTQNTPGEWNLQLYKPRGVGVVIAPWNFPLAILCGMSVAPLVAGNTVIMKPAEQTSLVAAAFMEILEAAGVPAGVANLLTGMGEEVGALLVEHPQVDFIAFTGSRAVGTQIWEKAGRTLPGQASLKKVVCEMGGKNPLIIDDSADLDEAIPAALHSAFGYSGQKCSALSRLIVLDGIYDRFVSRFVAGAASVPVGDPGEPGTVISPVIDEEAQLRILSVIERGKKEAQILFQGEAPAAGYFVPPTIFGNVKPGSFLEREEIFGPVVAVIRAATLTEAFAIANDTPYALTAGVFSRTPSTLERARREILAGNLYLNRGITGALVERQPFGGFKMSGGGTQAGGQGYLDNFLIPRVITENIVRRGFAE